MKKFIKVKCVTVGPNGQILAGHLATVLMLNLDLIAAFDNNIVLLKGGTFLSVGGRHYGNFVVYDMNDITEL